MLAEHTREGTFMNPRNVWVSNVGIVARHYTAPAPGGNFHQTHAPPRGLATRLVRALHRARCNAQEKVWRARATFLLTHGARRAIVSHH